MINPVTQGFTSNVSATKIEQNTQTRTNQSEKVENDKLSRIADQIKKGEYKLDLKATAQAITDSLL